MAKKIDWADEIYSGEATYGRINAVFGAVIITFIGVIMIIIGIVLITHKSHLKKIQGTVTSNSFCSQSQVCDSKNNCSMTYTCITSVKYTVNGKEYNQSLSTGSSAYVKGQDITFYYNPSDPSIIESSSNSVVGWVLIGFALLILFSSWSWVYITRKSKVAAAAGGTAATVGLFRDALR